MSTISAGTTSTTAFKVTGDTTGTLQLQTGATPTTAINIDASQNVTFTNNPTYSGGTANGVAYFNGSKVLTSGSALTFDGTKLGINTTSPLTKLDVRSDWITAGTTSSTNGSKILGGYSSQDVLTTVGSEYSSGGPVIGYGVWPSTSAAASFISAYSLALPRTAYTLSDTHRWYYGGSQTVALNGAVTMSEAMRLDSSGRLLIGGTTAYASGLTLTAQSNSFVVNQTSSTGYCGIRLYNDTASSARSLEIDYAGSAFASNLIASGPVGESAAIATTGAYPLCFGTANTFRALIDSNGNFAIGQTTAASGGSAARWLTIGTPSATTYSGGIVFAINNTTQAYIYQDTDSLLSFQGAGSNIGAKWVIGGSERARINSNGALLVGTTSQAGVEKFNVTASINSGASVRINQTNATAYSTSDYNGLVSLIISNPSTTAGTASGIGFITTGSGSGSIASIAGVATNNSGYGSALVFQTRATTGADAERMRITQAGEVLIGAVSSLNGERFNVTATGATLYTNGFFYNSNTSYAGSFMAFKVESATSISWEFLRMFTSTQEVVRISGNGNIGNLNNSYGAISDVKLKENITDATPKLADLMRVRIRNYNLKASPGEKQIGVVAQELEEVFPGMVSDMRDTDAKGEATGTTTKMVKYSVFVPMLIKAMQEQQALIESMSTRLAALEAK